jgi:hypothetical protein
MAKAKVDKSDKFSDHDFVLFDALAALDRKDYGWYDKLNEVQQRKFVPFILVSWLSAIKGTKERQAYYLQSVDYYANKYLLHEVISKHPKLQWLMLCAASPGKGGQFHQWIPSIKHKVSTLRESAKTKDIKDYYAKIYPKVNADMIKEIADAFMQEHKKKMYLAEIYPTMKLDDIEILQQFVTDSDIEKYEKARGNR